jgi:prepilin-type N-terminal cleavage/methylation domain-containing protein
MARLSASSRGATLVESLVALAILGIATAGILPAFTQQLHANHRSEIRSAAIIAAQQSMEALRMLDPETEIASGGSSAPRLVTVGGLEFEVVTHYCERDEFCDTNSRHIRIEVWFQDQVAYDVETVYTQLKATAS